MTDKTLLKVNKCSLKSCNHKIYFDQIYYKIVWLLSSTCRNVLFAVILMKIGRLYELEYRGKFCFMTVLRNLLLIYVFSNLVLALTCPKMTISYIKGDISKFLQRVYIVVKRLKKYLLQIYFLS